ncbi:MAG TPA: hypothetical protein PLQ81_05655 [bacterium]|nr:hypothetical protein [bacterium]
MKNKLFIIAIFIAVFCDFLNAQQVQSGADAAAKTAATPAAVQKQDNVSPVSEIVLNKIIKPAPAELAPSIEKYVGDKIIDTTVNVGKFLYAYSLVKTENYRKYAEEFVKLKAAVKRFSEPQITEFEKFIAEFKNAAEKNNPALDSLYEQILSDLDERKKIFNPQVKTKTIGKTDSKLTVFVNWFDFNQIEAPLLKSINIREVLKENIERSFKSSDLYEVNNNGAFKVEGQIKNFEIKNDRFNSNNEATERRVELLVDFRILESSTNQIITEKRNYYFEYTYYTLAFSGGIGISDGEGLTNFAEEAASKIFEELNSRFDEVRKQLASGKKAVELSADQKNVLKSMIPKAPKPPAPFSGTILLTNEDIRVNGNLESSGETKKHYNKLDGTADLKFNFKALDGDISSFVKLKGSSLKTNREFELDKITVDYKRKNLSLSAGNIFPFISKMIFNNAQEGVMVDYKIEQLSSSLKVFAGRDRRPQDFVNFNTLNLGASLTANIDKSSFGSFNVVYTKDNPNSISYDSAAMIPAQNTLLSFVGKFSPKKIKELSFNYEFAYSFYKDLLQDTDNLNGNAIDIKSVYTTKKNIVSFNYIWTDPNFVTLYGNVSVDRQKFDLTYTNKMIENMILKFNGIYQNDNLDEINEKTNYVSSIAANMNYQPFAKKEKKILKTLKMENSFEIRNTYNKLLGSPIKRDKNNRNLLLKIKFLNSFLSNTMNAYISYENENDEDKINFSTSRVKQYECSNSYSKKILESYFLDARGRYRYKTVDEKTDKLFNGSLSMRYSKNKSNCILSYYIDITASTVKDQDSEKQKIEAEYNYSNIIKKIKNNYIVKITYDINDFENRDLNFKKLTAYTGMKMEF